MYVPTLAAIDSLEEGLERVGEKKNTKVLEDPEARMEMPSLDEHNRR